MTRQWIKADDPALTKKRRMIVDKMRAQYHELDPFIRGRGAYHRNGNVRPFLHSRTRRRPDSSLFWPQIVGNVSLLLLSLPLRSLRPVLTRLATGPRRLELPLEHRREERGRVGGPRLRDMPRVVLAPSKGHGGGAQGGRLSVSRSLERLSHEHSDVSTVAVALSLSRVLCILVSSFRSVHPLDSPVATPLRHRRVAGLARGARAGRRKWRNKSSNRFAFQRRRLLAGAGERAGRLSSSLHPLLRRACARAGTSSETLSDSTEPSTSNSRAFTPSRSSPSPHPPAPTASHGEPRHDARPAGCLDRCRRRRLPGARPRDGQRDQGAPPAGCPAIPTRQP